MALKGLFFMQKFFVALHVKLVKGANENGLKRSVNSIREW